MFFFMYLCTYLSLKGVSSYNKHFMVKSSYEILFWNPKSIFSFNKIFDLTSDFVQILDQAK